MCGITGYIGSADQLSNRQKLIQAMTNQLAHRGPDGSDTWFRETVGFGHRRLAIIDLNTGDQPMWDAQQEQIIVFNGEIYNYPELRGELEQRGHRFLTASDTEIIPAVIKEWGISEGLLRLRGMFAFGLYNCKTNKMLLARDRCGIKPLYWTKKNNTIYFASEMKALLIPGLAERKINPASVHDYLAVGNTIAPNTCWAGIYILPPGSWMEVGDGNERQGTYWQWSPQPNESFTEEQWLDQFDEILSDALHSHLLADVPLGAFLSGGIDSSLAVAILAKKYVKGLNTFNVTFDESSYDESPFAKLVAAQYNTTHHEILVSSESANVNSLIRAIEQFDEPFGDLASLPNYLLSSVTSQHVKVVLSGDGGDEVMGGYPFYSRMLQIERISNFHWADPLMQPTLKAVNKLNLPYSRKALTAWNHAQGSKIERMVKQVSLYSESQRSAMYTDDFRISAMANGPTHSRIEKYLPTDITDPLDRMFAFEFRIRLQNGYLRKVDITSSAHGLETRVPFLDNRMLEFSEILPSRFKLNGKQLKYLAYRLAERYLPPEITDRTKHGFNFPFDHWSNTLANQKFLKELIFSSQARWHQFFKPDFIDEAWAAFTNQRTSPSLSRMGAYARIYSLTAFELWLQKWQLSL